MNSQSFSDLTSLGWNPGLESELHERFDKSCVPGRVARASKGHYLLWTGNGEAVGRLAGAFEFRIAGAADLPVVGDWVVARAADDSSPSLRIEGLLRRMSAISRKRAGVESVEQVLVANVDIACIVFSLEGGRKCSPRAAERYATMVWSSGAVPLILLNKADLASDTQDSVAEIASVAPGVEVLPLSCATGFGVAEVRAKLPAGKTTVLVGPSGVGKSTLINVLVGEERTAVGEVRKGDLKGRHTTTHRELFILPGGALVIDTPGLRELQLWADGADLDESFSEIASLARSCRFSDCTHSGEPGCAVQVALANGSLPEARFASFIELRKEIAFQERRIDERLRRNHRNRWKEISRQAKGFSKERRAGGREGNAG